jgi:hypothetical protein
MAHTAFSRSGCSHVESDDCSISTVGTSNLSSSSTVVHEVTVKFSFHLPSACNHYADAATNHIKCLAVIQREFPDVKIMDNFGQHLKTVSSSLGNESTYHRHFKLHFFPANEYKARPPMIFAVHRLYTTATTNQIRRHPLVSQVLQQTRVNFWNTCSQKTRFSPPRLASMLELTLLTT